MNKLNIEHIAKSLVANRKFTYTRLLEEEFKGVFHEIEK